MLDEELPLGLPALAPFNPAEAMMAEVTIRIKNTKLLNLFLLNSRLSGNEHFNREYLTLYNIENGESIETI